MGSRSGELAVRWHETLEAKARGRDADWQDRVDAKYTLKTFDEGTLHMDW